MLFYPKKSSEEMLFFIQKNHQRKCFFLSKKIIRGNALFNSIPKNFLQKNQKIDSSTQQN